MIHPDEPYPLPIATKNHFIFLKNFIRHPDIQVGDYTYYHDVRGPERFEQENVVILYGCKLIIGKFCQIAQGTKFIMGAANHAMDGFSTYPFFVFGREWSQYDPQWRNKGDTVVGNDVWFGHQSTILPGLKIGDGAIIGACAVVTKDVAPYTVVAGNPAKFIRQRFPADIIEELLRIQWWNWNHDKIASNLRAITSADITALRSAQ